MRILPPNAEIFLDASYAVALLSKTDAHHALATDYSFQLEACGARLVTTRGVLGEIGNGLARRCRREGAELLRALETDETVSILPFDGELYTEGLQLYADRPDKEWGLVDCVSFVVMRRRNLTLALTADRHFQQAGFAALLLD